MASTFYSQISANKRNSVLLALGLTLLLGALGLTIGYGLSGSVSGGVAALAFALILGIVLSLASYFQGDQLVLAASGAQAVTEEELPQLFNVVRELTIAANIPMPKVYVIDDTSMNAFATGRDPEHASIAVTKGLLSRMDREEVQGVIGHELSHVRNFDIRFSLIVGVMVGSIALLADFFLRFTFWGGMSGRRSSNRDNGGNGLQAVIMVVAIALAILAPIISRFIQLAVSRQREYLADASSVELTRDPYGLERALAKIGGDQEVLEVANRGTQHMYFTNPIKKFEARSSGLMDTHPPILDRINRLRQLTGDPPLDAADSAPLAGLD